MNNTQNQTQNTGRGTRDHSCQHTRNTEPSKRSCMSTRHRAEHKKGMTTETRHSQPQHRAEHTSAPVCSNTSQGITETHWRTVLIAHKLVSTHGDRYGLRTENLSVSTQRPSKSSNTAARTDCVGLCKVHAPSSTQTPCWSALRATTGQHTKDDACQRCHLLQDGQTDGAEKYKSRGTAERRHSSRERGRRTLAMAMASLMGWLVGCRLISWLVGW